MNEKTCRVCGTPFAGGTRRLYCSAVCRQKAFVQRHRAGTDTGPLTVACSHCGQNFHPARAIAKYCSNACRQKAYRQREADRKRNGAKGKVGR